MSSIKQQIEHYEAEVKQRSEWLTASKQYMQQTRIYQAEVKDEISNLTTGINLLLLDLMNSMSHRQFIKYMQVNYGW